MAFFVTLLDRGRSAVKSASPSLASHYFSFNLISKALLNWRCSPFPRWIFSPCSSSSTTTHSSQMSSISISLFYIFSSHFFFCVALSSDSYVLVSGRDVTWVWTPHLIGLPTFVCYYSADCLVETWKNLPPLTLRGPVTFLSHNYLPWNTRIHSSSYHNQHSSFLLEWSCGSIYHLFPD